MAKPIWETWPQWLVDAAVAAYKQGKSPAEIGAVIGRREGVVRHKLVREGVYISAAASRKYEIETQLEGF
jgi:hypothetical protein